MGDLRVRGYMACMFVGLSELTACKLTGNSGSDQAGLKASQDVHDSVKKHLFLAVGGPGSRGLTQRYYKQIKVDIDEINSLSSFKRVSMDFVIDFPEDGVVKAYYQNIGDLGFWREMVCSKEIGPGFGGCYVTNWTQEGDKEQHEKATSSQLIFNNDGTVTEVTPPPDVKSLGTVAMNISDQGFVRFYVFNPEQKLIPFAILDPEGEKNPPNVCTPCHGGRYDGSSPDTGAVFREFEPAWLRPASHGGKENAEKTWFALNQIVKKANASLIKSAAKKSTAQAATNVNATIDAIYKAQGVRGISIYDPKRAPDSWKKSEKGSRVAKAKVDLWTKLVDPYCMGCHRTNSFDFSNYENFSYLLQPSDKSGVSQLEVLLGKDPKGYLAVSETTPDATIKKFAGELQGPIMPHSYQTYKVMIEGNPLLSTQDRADKLPGPVLRKLIETIRDNQLEKTNP